jgi:predicted PurR-regulated permease PerM
MTAQRDGVTPVLRTFLISAAVVIIIIGMQAAAGVVNTLLLTMLFATIVSPLVQWLERKGLGRGSAVLIVVLMILLVGVVVMALLWAALPRLMHRLPAYGQMLEERTQGLAVTLERYGLDATVLRSPDVLSPSRLVSLVRELVGAATHSILQGILLLLLTIFFMLDMEFYRTQGRGLGLLSNFVIQAGDVRRYLSITGLTGLIGAVGNLVLLLVLGIDFPVIWAVLSFFANFIPNIGFYIALIPPLLVAVLEFGLLRAGLVLVGYFVINLVTDSIVKPRFLKKGIGITPFETLMSLVFWGWVLGAVGALLAAPLTMVVKSHLDRHRAPTEAGS